MKTPEHNSESQSTRLEFTDPKPGFGAHSRPQMRTPILTDAIELEHPDG